ncbi:MAG TPA: thiamine diphosphokinase [Clostridiales bacterium]|nr:thiamine diphosphokinase [Clostridiales bacterium]
MRVLIFANGFIDDYSYIKKEYKNFDYIICADGGLRHSDVVDIVPDLIVGDLDSVSYSVLKKYKNMGVPTQKYPTEKDVTDMQIAVDNAIQMGADEIVLCGALGDRWDHSYANVMLLYRIAKKGISGWIIDNKNKITISDRELEFNGKKGQILSLLPFGGSVNIKNTSGLKYPIRNKILSMDYPIGISNEFIDERVKITIHKGWLLAILIDE